MGSGSGIFFSSTGKWEGLMISWDVNRESYFFRILCFVLNCLHTIRFVYCIGHPGI